MNKKLIIFTVVVIFLTIAGMAFGMFYYVSKNGQTGPSVQVQQAKGVLEGQVTVGPICPVEKLGVPCPVPAAAYTSREVIVYAGDGQNIAARTHLDETGKYRFLLAPGTYIVDIPRTGVGSASKDLPHEVTIHSGKTVNFNFSIDTGIR